MRVGCDEFIPFVNDCVLCRGLFSSGVTDTFSQVGEFTDMEFVVQEHGLYVE